MAKNGSHFEHFWGCLQVFVLWGLAGMRELHAQMAAKCLVAI